MSGSVHGHSHRQATSSDQDGIRTHSHHVDGGLRYSGLHLPRPPVAASTPRREHRPYLISGSRASQGRAGQGIASPYHLKCCAVPLPTVPGLVYCTCLSAYLAETGALMGPGLSCLCPPRAPANPLPPSLPALAPI